VVDEVMQSIQKVNSRRDLRFWKLAFLHLAHSVSNFSRLGFGLMIRNLELTATYAPLRLTDDHCFRSFSVSLVVIL
jgi:hypothetical protein